MYAPFCVFGVCVSFVHLVLISGPLLAYFNILRDLWAGITYFNKYPALQKLIKYLWTLSKLYIILKKCKTV